jgi:hypothetical protein
MPRPKLIRRVKSQSYEEPPSDAPYYERREKPERHRDYVKEAGRRKRAQGLFMGTIKAGLDKLRATVGPPENTYDEALLEQTYKYALLGCTNREIAGLFGISSQQLDFWMSERPGFRDAMECGRDLADANVARSLYSRACGYSHPAVKIFYDKEAGEVVKVPYTEYYPPDTTAATKWLSNRRRHKDLSWADTQTVAFEGGPTDTTLPLPVIVINPIQTAAPPQYDIEGTVEKS